MCVDALDGMPARLLRTGKWGYTGALRASKDAFRQGDHVQLSMTAQAPKEAPRAHRHAQRRQRARDRDLAGAPIEALCWTWAGAQSGRVTWRERALAPAPSWSAALRRRPSTTPPNTPQRRAQVVVARRQRLAQQGTDGGAAATQQARAQRGRAPGPSPRTL
jgi:hypothetical protein